MSGTAPLKSEFDKDVESICLDHEGWHNLFVTVKKFKAIIRKQEPILIHSHLLVSSIIARLATPKSVPLFTTLHSIFSMDAFGKNKKSIWLERLTLKKRHNLIGVSKFVLDDYVKYIPFKGRSFVLYNFLPDTCFQLQNGAESQGGLKCIAVGNLKEAKNYNYLLEIYSHLRNTGITLDIYGEGAIKDELQQRIDNSNLPVRLLGNAENVSQLFKSYHLFVQASSHEGFGISVIEAMAAKLPVLISDIPVFREITSGYAHFFPLEDSIKAAGSFMHLLRDAAERIKYVNVAFDYCSEQYSSENYKQKLLSIYNSVLEHDDKLVGNV